MTTSNPTENVYRAGDRLVSLDPVDGLLAVRFKDHAPSRRRALLEAGDELSFITNLGVHVVATAERAEILEHDEDIAFASPVYRVRAGDEPAADDAPVVFTTRRLIAQFAPDIGPGQVAEIAASRRARVIGPSGLPNSFVLEAASTTGPFGCMALAVALVDEGLALRASPDIVHEIVTRGTTTLSRATRDTWHLDSVSVPAAWNVTKGASVTIAVLDDGLDTSHPEFAGRIDAEYDFDHDVADASPKRHDDDHGTACTGVAAAAGVEASGAAPEARIVAVRTPAGLGTVEEVEMWTWVGERADIVSCSWGPAQPYFPPDMIVEALRHLAEDARTGGVPIFFAAGNETEDMTTDGYAASPHVVAVAASTDEDMVAHYSDFGSEIDICAPSSGGTKGITTADRTGTAGYSADDYTTTFGGTSSATPLVAGVAALVRAANPSLTAGQVKTILYDTADKIGTPDDYDASGHSVDFGFGKVNAEKAVTAARSASGGTVVGGSTGGSTGGTTGGTPSVSAPASTERTAGPPTFQVQLAGNSFFSIEVATESRLFDGRHSGDRTDGNFTSTFREDGAVASGTSWTMGAESWNRLRSADRLFYRMLSSQRSDGTGGFHITTDDSRASSAPSIALVDAAGSGSSSGSSGSSGSASTPAPGGQVVFPSGSRFDIVTAPADGIDYDDPVTGGTVRLIEIRGRHDEELSDNFRVKEFVAGSGAMPRYARISPDFVSALQRLRTAAGASISIRSGYRHPAKNAAVGGAERSQHMVGRAADIRITGLTPLEMADLALRELGPVVGIGLGKTGIHIDTRGVLRTWAYDGAELSESEFDAWAANHAANRSVVRLARLEVEERGDPTVVGPGTWVVGDPPPRFLVRPGAGRFVALDLVTDTDLFGDRAHARTADNAWASWSTGLVDATGHDTVTLAPDRDAWNRLVERSSEIHYRALTTSDPTSWADLRSSVDDAAPWETPHVSVVARSNERSMIPHRFLGGAPPAPVPRATNRRRPRRSERSAKKY